MEGVVLPLWLPGESGADDARDHRARGSVPGAQSGVTFVDARPTSLDTVSRAPVKQRVVGARHPGEGQVDVEFEWRCCALAGGLPGLRSHLA